MTPGATVGRYSLVRPLGRGGMGEVWEAELRGPRGFRRRIALKVVRAERVGPELEAALVREAHVGALLHHPNVVGVYELDRDGDCWHVAMELVEGVPAAALVREGPLPAWAAVEIALQAAAGLHHVHELETDGRPGRVVHRDVKPANLLVDRHGLVKVADLGLASFGDLAGARAGTPGYMPPEQERGAAQDRRVDIHALGATLGALLTGRRPRSGEVPPGLGAFRELVARCLAPDPADRFPDCRAFAAALAALRPADGGSLAELVRACAPDPDPRANDPTGQPTRVLLRGNLPEPEDRFVGRARDLGELVAQLRIPGVISVVGPGGTGKSRLALEAARVLSTELAGGAWRVDLQAGESAEDAVRGLGAALGLSLDPEDPVGHVGRALAGLDRCLVLLDGVENVDLAALLAGFVDAAPRCSWLCTSRAPGNAPGERVVRLPPLDADDAEALFRARCPRSPAPAESGLVRALVRALGGLPLAIEIAAMRTARLGLREIHDRHVRSGGEGLRRVLEDAWSQLPEPARAALAQVPVFVGSFRVEAAEAVLDTGRTPVVDALLTLTGASLLDYDADRKRLSAPASVLEFARERADGPRVEAARRRHVAWYAQHGSEAALTALHRRGGTARVNRLAQDLANVELAFARAEASGDGEAAARCALAIGRVYRSRGPLGRLPALLARAVAIAPAARAVPLARELAGALGDLGQHVEAAEALRAVPEDDDPASLHAWGEHHRQHGRLGDAERLFERMLAVAGAANDLHELAWARVGLAAVADNRGEPAKVLVHAEAAREAFWRSGDRMGELDTLDTLAWARQRLGETARAREMYLQVIARLEELDRPRIAMSTWMRFGLLEAQEHRFAEARAAYHQALELARRVGLRRQEPVIFGNLATLAQREGSRDEALALARQAAALHLEHADRRGYAIVWGNLGAFLVEAGRHAEAAEVLREAVALHREIGNRPSEALALAALAAASLGEGRSDEALRLSEDALAVARSTGVPLCLLTVLFRRVRLVRDLGRAGLVEDALAEAAGLAPAGDAPVAALLELERVRLHLLLGERDAARALLARVAPAAERIHDSTVRDALAGARAALASRHG